MTGIYEDIELRLPQPNFVDFSTFSVENNSSIEFNTNKKLQFILNQNDAKIHSISQSYFIEKYDISLRKGLLI